MTSCRDVGLGERDQSLGLRGHPILTHFFWVYVNTFIFRLYQELLLKWRKLFRKPSRQRMAMC